MSTRVKICGLTSPEAAQTAVSAGADAIGLVFAKSPRRVSVEQAAEIAACVPALVSRVGVFVDSSVDELVQMSRAVGLDTIQLHGAESPETVAALKAEGLRVIKATRVRTDDPAELLDTLEPYREADALLLDSYTPGVAGGTGTSFAWPVAAEAAARRPIILAGGLSPANVAEALAAVRPYGVDVSSGVELSPGQKDPARVRAFIARVRRYDVESSTV